MFSPRFLALLSVVLGFLTPFGFADEPSATASAAKWEKEIAAIEQRDGPRPETKGGIVFVGSSSIRMWKTLAEDFPKHRVLNHGFGGSQLWEAVLFADRLVLAFEPRFIVVYSGGNDINAGRSAEQVFGAFKGFVAAVRAKQPQTPIAYISIAGNPKRWGQVDEVKKANALIKAYTQEQPNLQFINVFDAMLGSDGLPKPDIFLEDRLHMNAEGYRIWTKIVGEFLPAADR